MKHFYSATTFLISSLFLKIQSAHAAFGGIYEISGCQTTTGDIANIKDPGKNELTCVVQHTITMAEQTVGAILIVVIVISGIMYMTSMGNAEKVGTAKKTLVGAIIGLIIVVMSGTMVNLILILFQ